MLFCFYLQILSGLIFRYINGKDLRQGFCIVGGVLIQVFMFRFGILHFLVLTLVGHLIWTKMTKNKNMPRYVLIWCMTYLSAIHIYRIVTAYGSWNLDMSTMLMPLVSRISSLGYIIRDGTKVEEELTPRQREMRIHGPPSAASLLGYVCLPTCCLLGPFIEYQDYVKFIEQTHQYKDIPSSYGLTLKQWVLTNIWTILSVLVPTYLYSQDDLTTETFRSYNLFVKLFLSYVAMIGNRCLYYIAWSYTDTALILSGITYNGDDKFNRIASCNPLKIEFGDNPRDMIDVSSPFYDALELECYDSSLAEALRL